MSSVSPDTSVATASASNPTASSSTSTAARSTGRGGGMLIGGGSPNSGPPYEGSPAGGGSADMLTSFTVPTDEGHSRADPTSAGRSLVRVIGAGEGIGDTTAFRE